jgi:protein ImuB
MRTLVVWCPDWPVVAAGLPAQVPAAVFHANRVVACSAAARADGVRRGQRRREAQSRCPELVVETHDPGRDARVFEPVVAAVETFAPRVELTRPGTCALATRGPSRYFGGDEVLADRVAAAVDAVLAGLPGGVGTNCRTGVADGPFAAALAARRATVVPRGASGAFLAPFPVSVLDEPELAGLLVRLGVRTLGDFAALPDSDVAARFGPDGERAHCRARGLEDRRLELREPPPDLGATVELDPPADRVDTAAFAAKSMADQLCLTLAASGLVCTAIRIQSETEHGEHLERVWRHHRAFTPTAVADRVRWQLEGWLVHQAEDTTGGLTLIRLIPDEVVPDEGRQSGFWGGASASDERADRGLARLQGLLGPEAVVTGVVCGGRGPAEQACLVPWGDPRRLERPGGPRGRETPTWPGRIPAPAPALVHQLPLPAELVDERDSPVGVNGRGAVSSSPTRVSVAGGPWSVVEAWAGPWPADERWWDPDAHRRRARLQAVSADGTARLLALEGGRWWVEATYD